MDENDKLIEAAKLLQDFCKNEMHGRCFTEKCLFAGYDTCLLMDDPSSWTIPKPRRWTDADIALAKALKAVGAEHIYRLDTKTVYWGVDCCSRYSYELPPSAFANLKSDERKMLDEIIAEGATE